MYEGVFTCVYTLFNYYLISPSKLSAGSAAAKIVLLSPVSAVDSLFIAIYTRQ